MEPIRETAVLAIAEPTHTASARRAAADLCRRLQLSDATVARAELVAVELARNILQHAGRGHIYIGPVPFRADSIQILAADLGPGMGDLARAMRDGFSTGTTPGLGLGAIHRQADSVDIYSPPGAGTVLAVTLHDRPPLDSPNAAVLCTHIEGETLNGDSWAIYPLENRTVYLMVDGLGHGHYAAEASSTAIATANRVFAETPAISLSAAVERMHLAMKSTRGAAVLAVSVDGRQAICCGIGNVAGSLCSTDGSSRSFVSHNGTVGHRMTRVQEFSYPYSNGMFLILHTDGISARWKLSQYPDLLKHAPAIVAAVLYRDGARDRDDSSILVSRLHGGRTDA